MQRLLFAAALLLAGSAARAEGPVGPPEGGDPVEEIKKAAAKVTQGMKDSEEALTKVAKGEKADPKAVDITLPPPSTRPESDPHGST
jgi:hypothetical protein